MENSSNEICPMCNSNKVRSNEFSPEDKPYVIRIDHHCKACNYYWYEED